MLSEIIGQGRAISRLTTAMAAGKLSHAYVFCGPQAVGKRTTAQHFAMAINCQTAPQQGCDACPSCHKMSHGIHPDVHTIAPDGQYIKIDQIRAVQQLLMFQPHEAKTRVVIIDHAEQLHPNAANALLKSLEEPATRTCFILVTHAAHRMLPTILSRCQRVTFNPLTDDQTLQVVKLVKTQGAASIDNPSVQLAIELAAGSPGRALQLLDSERMALVLSFVDKFSEHSANKSMAPLFGLCAEYSKNRPVLIEALQLLQLRLQRQLRTQLNAGAVTDIVNNIFAVQQSQRALFGSANAALVLEDLGLRLQLRPPIGIT